MTSSIADAIAAPSDVRFGSKTDIGAHVRIVSALPPKADIGTQPRDVCFVPVADITIGAQASQLVLVGNGSV